jgi:hypothetical protein
MPLLTLLPWPAWSGPLVWAGNGLDPGRQKASTNNNKSRLISVPEVKQIYHTAEEWGSTSF